jgi:SAM-dependent methyltransferase
MADQLGSLVALGRTASDRELLERAVRSLDQKHAVGAKLTKAPMLREVLGEFVSRLLDAYGKLAAVRGQRVLDIASGSNSSRSPSTGRITVAFEPWMARLLAELGAQPVAVDIGDLDRETFEHYRADLGHPGALDFLPGGSFDAIHESRLFGSPEFRAAYGPSTDSVRAEIHRQERRLLRPGGILIHSDGQPSWTRPSGPPISRV